MYDIVQKLVIRVCRVVNIVKTSKYVGLDGYGGAHE